MLIATLTALCPNAGRGVALSQDEVPHTTAAYHGPATGRSCCLSIDGRKVLSCGADSAVLFDAATGERLGPLMHPRASIHCGALDPAGRLIALACEDGTVHIWDASNGQEQLPPLQHPASISQIDFGPGGKLVTVCEDGRARLWDVATRHIEGPPFKNNHPPLYRANLSADGRLVIILSHEQEGGIAIWDVASHSLARRFDNPGRAIARLSDDAAFVLIGGADHCGTVWSIKTGQVISRTPRQFGYVTCGAFSRDGKLFVLGTDAGLRVWNSATGAPVTRQLGDGASAIRAVKFSADGRLVFFAGDGGQAEVWNLSSGRRIIKGSGCHTYDAGDFSPDGNVLAATCDIEHVTYIWRILPPVERR